MRYQSPTQLALRQQGILSPLSRFPQGKVGAGLVPPTAQTTRLPPQEGFQSTPLKSPLRDPPGGPHVEDTFNSQSTCRHVGRHGNIIWSWGWFHWPVLK